MTATSVATALTTPRRSALERRLAMRLAADENARFLAQVRRLAPADWEAATDCPDWDVRSLVGHVVGMAEFAASVPEQIKQLRAAGKRGGVFIDALTSLQVDKHRGDSTQELVARYASVGPKAAKGRRRTPAPVRGVTMPVPQAVGGVEEKWKLGFLIDVVLTRDTWMHRIDVARAVGHEPELTADHDAVVVADVVAEWAGRHGQACTLTLTGSAGGTWTFGVGGPELTEDAVEFCRGLSGRGAPALGTEVPF